MRRRSDDKTIGGQVAGTAKKRGDWFLVNRHVTFFGRGALTLFRPEPGFFLWGLLFVRRSKTLVIPKGKVFSDSTYQYYTHRYKNKFT